VHCNGKRSPTGTEHESTLAIYSLPLEQTMTLSDVLPSVRQLSVQDKLRLIRILTEELDDDANNLPLTKKDETDSNDLIDQLLAKPVKIDGFKPLAREDVYHSFGAARKLMEAMKRAEKKGN
jgi:hypothetical protein